MTAADEARAEAFQNGWDARNPEVAALTAQLAESERVAQVRLERLDQLLSESGSYDRARAASVKRSYGKGEK